MKTINPAVRACYELGTGTYVAFCGDSVVARGLTMMELCQFLGQMGYAEAEMPRLTQPSGHGHSLKVPVYSATAEDNTNWVNPEEI